MNQRLIADPTTPAYFIMRATNALLVLTLVFAVLVCGTLLPLHVAAKESGEENSESLKSTLQCIYPPSFQPGSVPAPLHGFQWIKIPQELAFVHRILRF